MRLASLLKFTAIAIIAVGITACGYSEEEWQSQLDKYNRLVAQNQSNEQRVAVLDGKLKAESARIAKLEGELEAAGVDISKLNTDLESRSTELSQLSSTLEEREKALAEYKRRAAQLEAIKQRFERLRSKLNELTNLGLKVTIRNNRMIISLPGDVLFESGKDGLKKEGNNILGKVAKIIGGDTSLRSRQYQVAGHTDNVEMNGGYFKDNWGLSLMRARTVLLYLVNPKQGGLPPKKWSASGFADTDPVAKNDDRDGRQANRRCELIVVPSAEEMLDLAAIAK